MDENIYGILVGAAFIDQADPARCRKGASNDGMFPRDEQIRATDKARSVWSDCAVMKRGCILLGLFVSGCGLGPALEIPLSEPEPEPNYRQLIADNAELSKFGSPRGLLEVSPLRPTKPLQPGDWMACVRSTTDGQMAYFAVFFKAHGIEAVRRVVGIDGCEDETFGALPKPTPPKPAKS